MERTTCGLIAVAIICAAAALLATDRPCDADDKPSKGPVAPAALAAAQQFTPTGPAETAAFEEAMYVRYAVANSGIWPRQEALANAKPAKQDTKAAAGTEEWLGRVVKKSIQPKDGQWNKSGWLLVPKLRWNSDYVLGHFTSQDMKISRIEFQQARSAITITIRSESLFPNQEYGDKQVRELLGALVNIPEKCLEHIEVDSATFRTGSDKKQVVTYGKIFDSRNKDPMTNEPTIKFLATQIPADNKIPTPPTSGNVKPNRQSFKPLIPDKMREWHSPMSFCIFDGRLIVSVSTIDWKNDGVPME